MIERDHRGGVGAAPVDHRGTDEMNAGLARGGDFPRRQGRRACAMLARAAMKTVDGSLVAEEPLRLPRDGAAELDVGHQETRGVMEVHFIAVNGEA